MKCPFEQMAEEAERDSSIFRYLCIRADQNRKQIEREPHLGLDRARKRQAAAWHMEMAFLGSGKPHV
jgi:hypothetical protein